MTTINRAVLEQEQVEYEVAPNGRRSAVLTAMMNARTRAVLAQEQEPAPMPPFPPVSQWQRGCAVCGLGANGNAYGFVCPRYDCPTKVTCGGAV